MYIYVIRNTYKGIKSRHRRKSADATNKITSLMCVILVYGLWYIFETWIVLYDVSIFSMHVGI